MTVKQYGIVVHHENMGGVRGIPKRWDTVEWFDGKMERNERHVGLLRDKFNGTSEYQQNNSGIQETQTYHKIKKEL
ncbi:hypothetical protein [Pediococcus argentinicus]|nr:hypothetical protein [Pediococcus argentinicus]NKZ22671.1 hypothetical protein [Pediococcus argentinicus]GEP19688.1 hypothetical protein LSA03_10720 [Pediococcus argentinicus]